VSLADKLDTVVGLFSAGEKVTGSRDPFGLRRAAQGIVKLLADRDDLGVPGHVSIGGLVDRALAGYGQKTAADAPDWSAPLGAFFAERVRHLLERRGASVNEANAIVPVDTPLARVGPARRQAPSRSAPAGAHVGTIPEAGRAVQTGQEHLKGRAGEMSWDELSTYGNGPAEPAEKPLIAHAAGSAHLVTAARQQRKYLDAFTRLADLQPDVSQFFDDVMVMADDPVVRRARLQLMANLRDLVLQLADISEIA
jgi:glycyl-tRNA synthetase beta chain